MRRIEAKENQSLLDISIQEFGTAIYVKQIAEVNDISITCRILAGQPIIIPEGLTKDEKTIRYYNDNDIIPASAQITDDIEELITDDDIIDENQSPPIVAFDPTFDDAFA